MPEEIDLLNEIAARENTDAETNKHGKFRASIITAYTAYLPFYENVVLRRLMASGCRYNVLLLDANDLAQSLQDVDRIPRLAGKNYILVPMITRGAYHPKIVMLFGEQNARVLVGSHNTTLSGFGHNRELTTRIDLGKGLKGEYRPFFQATWSFIESWLSLQRDHLPANVIDSVIRIKTKYAPWLQEQYEQHAELRFLGTDPDGENLWQKALPFIPKNASKVIVLGPFFDKEAAFLKKLNDDLHPQSISAALDLHAENMSLCRLDGLPHALRFRDASNVAERSGYLHAKALYLENIEGEAVLLTGSANPSHPAWTASPTRRNAEAMVLHLKESARENAEQLGLLQIQDMPEIGYNQLSAIVEKSTRSHTPQSLSSTTRILVGEAVSKGIFVFGPKSLLEKIVNCHLLFNNTSDIDNAAVEVQNEGVLIRLSENIESVIKVILTLSDEHKITLFVHNPESISKLATTSKQQSFRDALDSLGSESPDFSTLLRLADQLIFEKEKAQEAESKVKATQVGKQKEEKGETTLGPLSVSISETKRSQRRHRELHYGDLAYVIDALIYHLGIGLREAAEKLESHEPSEEEQIGAEEECQPPIGPDVQPVNLVKICHSKVRTLVNRMSKQLDNVHADSPEAVKVVEQLLAVLAVLREVRANDLSLAHLTEGESLVPMEQRKKLLHDTLKTMFGSQQDLFDKTAGLFKDDPENDMPRLLGLIIWLAWDCDLDMRKFGNIPVYEYEARHEALLELAKLLEIAQRAGRYDAALEEAKHSAWRTTPERNKGKLINWMRLFENWAKDLTSMDTSTQSNYTSDRPMPGQIGVAFKDKKTKFRMILEASQGKIKLSEIGTESGEKQFLISAVQSYQMPTHLH